MLAVDKVMIKMSLLKGKTLQLRLYYMDKINVLLVLDMAQDLINLCSLHLPSGVHKMQVMNSHLKSKNVKLYINYI